MCPTGIRVIRWGERELLVQQSVPLRDGDGEAALLRLLDPVAEVDPPTVDDHADLTESVSLAKELHLLPPFWFILGFLERTQN